MTDGSTLVCDGIGGVRKYQPDGTLVGTIHPKDANGNLLRSTNDIAVDAAGNPYYLDMGGKTLYVFNPQGTLLTTWTGEGSNALYAPADVTVGPDGAVYIVDYQANRIQKFTATLS